MKLAVITDSTADLSQEQIEQYNIHIVHLSVIFDQSESYSTDKLGYYQKLETTTDLPTTSQPAIGEFVALYEQLREQGYEGAMVPLLSSGFSGTYQTAKIAADMVDNFEVFVYDSEIACTPLGWYAIKCSQLIEQGVTEPSVIIEALDVLKNNTQAYFMVDNLSHLQRSGRIKKAEAFLGSMLKVKPILHIDQTVIVPYEKIRTKKKAVQRLIYLMDKANEQKKVHRAVVIHVNDEETAQEVYMQLQEEFPNIPCEIALSEPVIATHLGPGAIALGWIQEEV